jgi:hypothetical protein
MTTFDFVPDIRLESCQLLFENELKEKLGRLPRYYLTFWTSLTGDQKERLIRVSLRRQGVDQLVPHEYQELFRGQECKFLPWKPQTYSSEACGVATGSCIEFSLLRETVSHDCRVAFDTVGSGSVSILNVLAVARVHKHFAIETSIKLRATQDVVGGVMFLRINNVCADFSKIVEVYDPAMEPDFQSGICQTFCSLGWVHMIKTDPTDESIIVNPSALDPLLPIAARSIVPMCNTPAGVVPVDFFFGIHNAPCFSHVSEPEWLTIAEDALWSRELSIAEAEKLLDENLDQSEHYRPRFELVISAFAKMLTGPANSMPYRSDTFRQRSPDAQDSTVETGTDYFRSALAQVSGDCEDLAKVMRELADQFTVAKFTTPVLQKLQRLADCYDAQGQLLIVTSAKLETDDKAAAHKFVPITERQCGLHAAVMLVPRPQFTEMLARTVGNDQAKTVVTGLRPPPPVATSVGVCQLEGTGNMNSRLLPMNEYLKKSVKAHPADASVAAEMVAREESRIKATMNIFKNNQELMASFGFKPEMAQVELGYQYDFDKIWTGDSPSASHFYVSLVELFTTTPMHAGQRNCRFALVDKGANGEDLKKSALLDSIISGDSRVAMFPQPPVTDDVYRCSSVLMKRQEPSPFSDAHPHFNGPDVLLSTMASVFGTQEIKAPSDRHVPVDLYAYNWRIDAADRANEVAKLKQKLQAIDGVDSMYFRLMKYNSGLVTGVVRMWVDGSR